MKQKLEVVKKMRAYITRFASSDGRRHPVDFTLGQIEALIEIQNKIEKEQHEKSKSDLLSYVQEELRRCSQILANMSHRDAHYEHKLAGSASVYDAVIRGEPLEAIADKIFYSLGFWMVVGAMENEVKKSLADIINVSDNVKKVDGLLYQINTIYTAEFKEHIKKIYTKGR